MFKEVPRRGGRPRKPGNPIRTIGGKFLITEKNLFNRIQTRLALEGPRLHTALSPKERAEFGRYYILRFLPGEPVTKETVNLEGLGRELGVLRANEILQKEGGETPSA